MALQRMLTDGKRGPAWLLQTALRGQAHGQGAATKGLARSQGATTREPERGQGERGAGRMHEALPPEVSAWSKRSHTRAVTVGIDAGNKTHLAAGKISQVARPPQSNHAPLPIFQPPMDPFRSREVVPFCLEAHQEQRRPGGFEQRTPLGPGLWGSGSGFFVNLAQSPVLGSGKSTLNRTSATLQAE